jgi:hypothetical protein
VTETPDNSKIAVLSRGTEKASIGIIPAGGQVIPNSAVGDRDE